jgi:hypothetical protein
MLSPNTSVTFNGNTFQNNNISLIYSMNSHVYITNNLFTNNYRSSRATIFAASNHQSRGGYITHFVSMLQSQPLSGARAL